MINKIVAYGMILGVLIFVVGCGGGSSGRTDVSHSSVSSSPFPVLSISSSFSVSSVQEASAFLSKATFGAAEEEIEALVNLNDYKKWIEDQFKEQPNYHMEWVHAPMLKGSMGSVI